MRNLQQRFSLSALCFPHDSREVTTLQDLIKAQQHMAEWQFLPTIVSLQSAHSKLVNWNFIVPLGNHVGLASFSLLGHCQKHRCPTRTLSL